MRAIIVTGSRHAVIDHWGHTLYESIRQCKSTVPNLVIIHGNAPGIDKMVNLLFENIPGYTVIPMPAQWDKFGKSAGMARNNKMLQVLHALKDTGYETAVMAFHSNVSNSKGTRGMINIAVDGGHETWLHDLSGAPIKIKERIK